MIFKNKMRILIPALCLMVLSSLYSAEGLPELDDYSTISVGGLNVLYGDRDSASAAVILNWIEQYRPQPGFLAGRHLDSVTVVIAPSDYEYRRLSGGGIPEWGVAFAVPDMDMVILRSPRLVNRWIEDPHAVLNHELSHVFLDRQLRPARIPRWFQEGYAVYCADMWGMDDMFEASLALAIGAFMPLDDLADDFPASEARARRAYLQSYTVVSYMFSNWDSVQLALLFDRWRETGDLDSALRRSVGLTLAKFEQNWRDWVGLRYGWLRLIGSATLLWIIAAGLFIIVFVNRRLRYHHELEKMRRIEARYRINGPWIHPEPQYEWKDNWKVVDKNSENDGTESGSP